MSSGARIVVTGTGAISALGVGVPALWSGLLTGRSGITRIAALERAGTRSVIGGATPLHDHPERDRALAEQAIDAALDQAGLAAEQTALVWANGLDTTDAAFGTRRPAGACFAALSLRHRRPRRMVAMACASGTATLGEGYRLLRAGRARAVVTGGSSAILSAVYITGFAALGALVLDHDDDAAGACRPFDARRGGFALSDGAAALVVETLDGALARGAVPLAEVIGYGASSDAHDLNRPPADGSGARRCVERALQDADLAPGAIDAISAHGTGTVAGDMAEAAALAQVFRHQPPVYSCKGALGHSMAAAGALEAVVAVCSLQHGRVPATCNLEDPDPRCDLNHVVGEPLTADVRRTLSLSCGMGGQNTAVILQRVMS